MQSWLQPRLQSCCNPHQPEGCLQLGYSPPPQITGIFTDNLSSSFPSQFPGQSPAHTGTQHQRASATPPKHGFKEDLAIQLFCKQAVSTAIWNPHSSLQCFPTLIWLQYPLQQRDKEELGRCLLLQIIHKQPLSLCASEREKPPEELRTGNLSDKSPQSHSAGPGPAARKVPCNTPGGWDLLPTPHFLLRSIFDVREYHENTLLGKCISVRCAQGRKTNTAKLKGL